jgi:uncharacterized protein
LRGCEKPKLLIQGANDRYASRSNVEALFATLPEPKRLVIVDDADHFFTGRLDAVSAAMGAWLDQIRPY